MTADLEYESSRNITKELTELIYTQNSSLHDLNIAAVNEAKKSTQVEKNKRFKTELELVMTLLDPLTAKSLQFATEKSASSWLTALPLKNMGYLLNKQEFRDAICLRYNWHIADIPRYCACGKTNDIVHTLTADMQKRRIRFHETQLFT